MRKKKVSGILMIISLLAAGCGTKTENTIDEVVIDQSSETVQQENTEEISQMPQEEIESEAEEWATAYVDYLNALENKMDLTYSLIYVNDDDIPELVMDSGFEASGCQVATFYEGELDILQTDRLEFDYIEKENLLCNSSGIYGYYYDIVYTITDGKWNCIARGNYGDGPDGVQSDEDGNLLVFYTWEGTDVDENEYERSLKEIYDKELAKEPNRYYVFRDIRSVLMNGAVESANNRYELIVQNCTWEQAYLVCEYSGGYLATITSQEEMERIQSQILAEGKADIAFWVGARDTPDYFGYCWLEPDADKADYGMLSHYNALWSNFWQKDEPSYDGLNEAGTEVDENCVWLCWQEDEGKFVLQDMPSNVLAEFPSYTGKIGYICEYSALPVEER